MPALIKTAGCIALALAAHLATAEPAPYAGQQKRAIKSLSDQDVTDLLQGQGMGLAKAAELNGYPGPAHVLEHADALALTDQQRTATTALLHAHKEAARKLGAALIASEEALDEVLAKFLTDGVNPEEFARIKAQVRAAEIYGRDNVQGLARTYGAALSIGLTVQDVQDWATILQDVTAEEVKTLAEKHYGPLQNRKPVAERRRTMEPPPNAERRVTMRDARASAPSWQRQYMTAAARQHCMDARDQARVKGRFDFRQRAFEQRHRLTDHPGKCRASGSLGVLSLFWTSVAGLISKKKGEPPC